jgi:autoinducer 2-degrading protein
MLILLVHVRVKPEAVESFKTASVKNAAASLTEPGCKQFDVSQQLDDPTRFILYEAYRTADDHAAHRETAHYAEWRDTVADMMAEARTFAKYASICPPDADW